MGSVICKKLKSYLMVIRITASATCVMFIASCGLLEYGSSYNLNAMNKLGLHDTLVAFVSVLSLVATIVLGVIGLIIEKTLDFKDQTYE